MADRIRVIVITTDGVRCGVDSQLIENTLDSLRDIVDGFIEYVSLGRRHDDGTHMYIDDEGKLRDLPFNELATRLVWSHGYIPEGSDFIAGNAVICGDAGDGEDGDCPSWVYKYFGLDEE